MTWEEDERTYIEEHELTGSSSRAEELTNRKRSRSLTMPENVEMNVTYFPVQLSELQDLVDPKSVQKLQVLGGIDGLAMKLNTHLNNGLSSEEVNEINSDGRVVNTPFGHRVLQFGKNVLPPAEFHSFLSLVWGALQDTTLIILMVAALVSIGIGIYNQIQINQARAAAIASGQTPSNDIGSWVDGIAILAAVVLVVLVNSVNDYRKQLQFRQLNKRKEEHPVNVVRNGVKCQISVFDLLVGDILMVEQGDIAPADGVLIEAHNISCDESGITGESQSVKKSLDLDPFIISGTTVLEGVGKVIVIAVGVHSMSGKIMLALRTEPEDTPLQVKLEELAENIGKAGLVAAVLMLIILIIEYCVETSQSASGWPAGSVIANNIVSFFITAITIVVVAVPEGLPMAVTLALAYATIQMLKDNNLVRVLAACETMGGATTICSDKTGTLTENKMTVICGTIAQQEFSSADSNDLQQRLVPLVCDMIIDAIVLNTTAFEIVDDKQRKSFTGSKTEGALINFAKLLRNQNNRTGSDYTAIREETNVERLLPFSSHRKRMSTVVKNNYKIDSSPYVLYTKGASEILLELCTSYINGEGAIVAMDDDTISAIAKLIDSYANNALRTLCIAFRFLDISKETLDTIEPQDIEKDLIFLGVVGIEDPLRPEVPLAVRRCQDAGIRIRMVTGDNIVTARKIARECGILHKGGIVMEGPEFRRLPQEQMLRIIPNLEVLARSSPTDKQLLVQKLKDLGQTVAVTGDGTNDGPALKLADVGFAMGIAGTEVAKEAADIILMDDNFASIVKAVVWGRSVYDSVRKFLQFQLTVNIVAVTVAFISAVTDSQNQSVLTAVQLLWVNLIMDTFAALALATEPPSPELLNRPPHRKSDPLISGLMWRQVIGQSIFQVALCFLLLYYGPSMFQLDTSTTSGRLINRTIVFNSFVMMQLFNEINCRKIGREWNVFDRIHRHKAFLLIMFITIVVQIIVVEFGNEAFQTTALIWWQWLVCVAIGMISLPLAWLIKLVPEPKQTQDDETHLTREKLLWETAIGRIVTQIRVVKTLRSASRYKQL